MKLITYGDIEDCEHTWTEPLDDESECDCGIVICMNCSAEFETKEI